MEEREIKLAQILKEIHVQYLGCDSSQWPERQSEFRRIAAKVQRGETWTDRSGRHWGKGVTCKCNHPDPLICHECEESTGACYCECHDAARKAISVQRAALQREHADYAQSTELQRLRNEVIDAAKQEYEENPFLQSMASRRFRLAIANLEGFEDETGVNEPAQKTKKHRMSTDRNLTA